MRNLVLLAHPDDDALRTLVERLEKHGFNCLRALTGTEAMASVLQYAPQMVIAATDLPELQGTEVCLRLKQDPATEAIAVLLLGQKESSQERFVGSQVGADAYIPAPWDPEELAKRVADMFVTEKLNAKSFLKDGG